MTNAPMPAVLLHDADAWSLRINASWRRSLESIIETGRLLIDAKAQLVHGQWESMLAGALDFNPSVAQRLMIVARDTRLTNPAHGPLLPRSWRTLYELSKLSDGEFDRGIAENIIHADMERADVELIRPTPSRGIQHSSDGGVESGHANAGEKRSEETVLGNRPAEPRLSSSANTTTGRGSEAGVAPGPSEATPMPGGGLAIAHNRIEAADSRDFFPTPLWSTRALVEHVLPQLERRGHCQWQTVWEPACGEGHMAAPLSEYFKSVTASDLYPYGYGAEGVDFLDDHPPAFNPDWIITNPPFNKSADFVLKAIDLAGTGVAMFVRMAWLEGVDRYERVFRDHPPTLISFFTERVPLHKGRWEPEGVTFTAYIWLVWIKGAEPRAPFWIPPGCRDALTRPDDAERFGVKRDEIQTEGEAA